MSVPPLNRKTLRVALLWQIAAGTVLLTTAEAQSMNPIGRVARLFNRKLVEVEDRMAWLRGKIDHLASFTEHPMRDQVGWRCGKMGDGKEDPTVTLDLHRDVLLGEIYLVPVQRQPGGADDLFPKRFTVEAAREADFSDARQVYQTGPTPEPALGGYPFRLNGNGIPARYLRVTFNQGVHSGLQGVCALSEIFVFSGSEPVSFGATVTATQSVNIPGVWDPRFLVDGRTPLGLWEGPRWSASRGDCLDVPGDSQRAEWTLALDRESQLDQVVVYPYSLPELSGPGVIPPHLKVEIASQADFSDAVPIGDTGERDLPVDLTTPIVIPVSSQRGRFVRLSSDKAWQMGSRYLQALGEIEIWSGDRNLAAGQTVNVAHAGLDHPTAELTDGSSNGLQILPLHSWLSQLVDRSIIEREMDKLRPLGSVMAAESELNTTWGAAIALGLTFLIPVAIVERRRLVSKSQLEQLRKRIASDLHDDIGSNLGSISLIARSAKRDLEKMQGGPNVVSQDLGEVETIARESSLAMRDIVWLLERRQDTIGDFIQRMRDTAARLLRDTEYSIVSASNKNAAKLTLDAKRHLFLFYKEALHNILKHSKATQVLVRLHDSRDRLILEIQDNGVGLPQDADGKPRGVAKLTDRAKVLEGLLDVESSPGKGTTLRLSVKRGNLVASKLSADE
jgi:signal transduction histidine kinase